jgi:hypothetical protein
MHEKEGQVEPFIRLQEEGSDLCYLMQSSNALYYHLRLRMVLGDEKIKPFNLNNARHIRDVYARLTRCDSLHIKEGRGEAKFSVEPLIYRKFVCRVNGTSNPVTVPRSDTSPNGPFSSTEIARE